MINPNDITTIRVGQLPNAAFSLTSVFPFEIADMTLNKATFQDLVNFINIHSAALQFEVKRLSVNSAYITANFDATGLGKNLCLGFAICNGQNGTENLDGLVGVGYGVVNSNIGGFGGSKTHTLIANEMPAHSHGLKYANTGTGTKYPETPYIGDTVGGNMQGTENAGGNAPHNNMQPYVINLYIMKL
jgi:hypothetical protein